MGNAFDSRGPHNYITIKPPPPGSKGGRCKCGCQQWCPNCPNNFGWRCKHGNKKCCSGNSKGLPRILHGGVWVTYSTSQGGIWNVK